MGFTGLCPLVMLRYLLWLRATVSACCTAPVSRDSPRQPPRTTSSHGSLWPEGRIFRGKSGTTGHTAFQRPFIVTTIALYSLDSPDIS